MITDTANQICQSAPLEESSSGTSLSGDAKAKVGGIIGKIADLGVSAAADYQSGKSTGVLQKDLIAAIQSGNDCKLNVLVTLERDLLGEHEHKVAQEADAPAARRAEAITPAVMTTGAVRQKAIEGARSMLAISGNNVSPVWSTTTVCGSAENSYIAEIDNGSLVWRNGSGNIDTEVIDSGDGSAFQTTTVESRHINGRPERTGTVWTYDLARGRVRIQANNGRPPFYLTRCPS